MREIKFRIWVKGNEYPVWDSYLKSAQEKFPNAFGRFGMISDKLGKELDDYKENYIKEHGDLFKVGKDISIMVYDGFVVTPYGGVNFPEGGWDINGEDDKNAILMQYTGLKDKNGKEIYSGDLFMDEEDGTYNFVEWNDVYGGWGTNQWFLPKELVEQAPTLEIVGNIYEDSHLLNEKI